MDIEEGENRSPDGATNTDTKMPNNHIPLEQLRRLSVSVGKESTEEYLDNTIGDVLGEILEQCAKDTPPDPILHLANLLER